MNTTRQAIILALLTLVSLHDAVGQNVAETTARIESKVQQSSPTVEQNRTTEQALLNWWRTEGTPPLDYIVKKFDTHRWVFLGEYHRIKSDVELISALIPTLHEKTEVRHLALEFLCRDRTDEANALIARDEFDRRETVSFFRSQFPGWPYEEYLEIFRTAWESNQVYSAERGMFRFVGLHPCPDYEAINFGNNEEIAQRERDKLSHYDEVMADALLEGVMEPGHAALIYTGIAHATAKFTEYRFGTNQPLYRMGNLVYREPYRASMFFIAFHAPFWDSETSEDIYPFDGVLDRLMMRHGYSVAFDVVGSPFANLRHQQQHPLSITAHLFGELYDGYIIWQTPLKEVVGVTCIADWIVTEQDKRQFWRNLGNKNAAQRFSTMSLDELRSDNCAPRSDHGLLFRRRFRELPDLHLDLSQ